MLNGGYQCSKKLSAKELFSITGKDITRNNDCVGSLNKGTQMSTKTYLFSLRLSVCLLIYPRREHGFHHVMFLDSLDAFQEIISQIQVVQFIVGVTG